MGGLRRSLRLFALPVTWRRFGCIRSGVRCDVTVRWFVGLWKVIVFFCVFWDVVIFNFFLKRIDKVYGEASKLK